MNSKHTFAICFISIFTIMFLASTSFALDCSKCHTTEPGKSAVRASNTLDMSACLKCHNPNHPPTPIGYNTHLAHVGKYSSNVDFLTRHPNPSKSISCGDCHKQVFDCTNCHVVGIPHIAPPLGNNCKGCHGTIDNLFRHPAINLTIHNIFHLNSTKDCAMCHNPDSMNLLKLANEATVPIEEDYRLCQQCHSPFYNQWDEGSHFVNKTSPSTLSQDNVDFGGQQVTDTGWEDTWRKDNSCTNCHNPHNPSELYQLPMVSANAENAANVPGGSSLYIGGAISIIVIAVVVGRRYKDEISRLKNLSLPKYIRTQKISLPISISVESEESESSKKSVKAKKTVGTVNAREPVDVLRENVYNREPVKPVTVEPDKLEKERDRLLGESDMPAKMSENLEKINIKKKKLSRGNILFVLSILILLGSSYAILGSFLPLITVTTGSMSPHIQTGDMVIYQDISRVNVNNIKLHDNSGYNSLGDYGDVIIFKPYGGDGTPIIHRAMYYVEQGQAMWSGGPSAPYAGYITKGDNNAEYDQQIANSYNQPVKKEWIIGVARYRIPYLGYLRMMI
jgi:signal peptidase